MTDDTFKKLVAQMRPLVDVERANTLNNAISRHEKDMAHFKQMLGAASAPMEEFRRSASLGAASNLQTGLAAATQAILDTEKLRGLSAAGSAAAAMQKQLELQKKFAQLEARFKLPELTQATKLMESFRSGHASVLFKQYEGQDDYLLRATAAMRSPWLDMLEQTRSIEAFAKIQSMGFALKSIPAFDDRLTELLRKGLGDWQGQIHFPKDIYDDPLARSAFYQERGFDSALTAFPPEAFAESLNIAGLMRAQPPIVDIYDCEDVTADDAQEASFSRNNSAYDLLLRFETQLRQFIDQRMTKACGADWIKHRVSGDMRGKWSRKQQIAREDGGGDHPLIAFADFTDYVEIIIQRNNWPEVFEPVFRRKTSVQESFHRLTPSRHATMHSRIISQDDVLLISYEITRIYKAIGIR